jgi:hypothetical protein
MADTNFLAEDQNGLTSIWGANAWFGAAWAPPPKPMPGYVPEHRTNSKTSSSFIICYQTVLYHSQVITLSHSIGDLAIRKATQIIAPRKLNNKTFENTHRLIAFLTRYSHNLVVNSVPRKIVWQPLLSISLKKEIVILSYQFRFWLMPLNQ